MNNILPSLKLCKELASLLPKDFESDFVYTRSKRKSKPNSKFGNWFITQHIHQTMSMKYFILDNIFAPTFEEILPLLPKHISSDQVTERESVSSRVKYLHSRCTTPYYIHYYSPKYGILDGSSFEYSYHKEMNLVSATVKLLIWLHENNYIED
jgi:hypothetical protein